MREGVGGGGEGSLSAPIPAQTDSQAHGLSLQPKTLVLKSLLCVKSYLTNTDEPEDMRKAPASQDVLEGMLRVFRWGRGVGRIVVAGLCLGWMKEMERTF